MKKTARIKPFLVLPLLQIDLATKNQEPAPEMPSKTPGLNLFIKTWPHKTKTVKKKDKEEENRRPLTATLEKPTILDIRLMGKIDMSKIRKEFLNISNLCRMPLILKKPKCTKPRRPLSLPPPKNKVKKKHVDCPDSSSWEEESARSLKPAKIKEPAKPAETKTKQKKTHDANNNSKQRGRKCGNVAGGVASTKLPGPCNSCGRNDLPERFHSHPTTGLKSGPKMEEVTKIPVKSSVQKPVAIKYKSKPKIEVQPPTSRKPSLPHQKLVHSAPKTESRTPELKNSESKNVSRAGSAKRTLTCYLCGREFGSASLPLHEPKCLQRWERENASLPRHLQRKPPPKPDSSISKDEWDKLAWQSSQSALLPCSNCGRTFYPDRLLVHQRSCKSPQSYVKPPLAEVNPLPLAPENMSRGTPSPHRPPPTFECYICGKPFGVNSINVHEKHCLKKWNLENDSLPPDMKSPPPTRKEKPEIPESHQTNQSSASPKDMEERPSSSKKPPLFPCYLCGKLFSVNSIYIHEPQCLKKWNTENDKLPPNRRRAVPLKPDIKFTRDGKVDFEATNEANWHSHLSQLIPCKNCSRTFNPDRIDVHERSCKGS